MEIKLIPNDNFFDLATLYVDMNKVLSENVKAAPALYILTHDLATKHNFVAIGLYLLDKLVGFVTGYELSEKKFYFSGIFCSVKTKKIKDLIEFSFKYIEELGYNSWEADSNNRNIASILSKYGAKPTYTRYKKEA